MNQDFEQRMQEVIAFAKEKQIFISACQEIKDGRILTVPLYHDLKPKEDATESVEGTV